MRELALFAGTGMGVYGTGLDTIAYCEVDPYRRKVLQARMRDGLLPTAEVWPNVKRMVGYMFRDKVDIETGGFPCQAHSLASHGKANAEDLWPEMLRVIEECDARHVFAENVQRKPIERAAAD